MKKQLMNLVSGQGLILGAAALALAGSAWSGSGTLAAFQAQTTNPGNSFKAGILRMQNEAGTVNGGANCTADGATVGVLSGSCAQVFKSDLRLPGDTSSNTVKITNAG